MSRLKCIHAGAVIQLVKLMAFVVCVLFKHSLFVKKNKNLNKVANTNTCKRNKGPYNKWVEINKIRTVIKFKRRYHVRTVV